MIIRCCRNPVRSTSFSYSLKSRNVPNKVLSFLVLLLCCLLAHPLFALQSLSSESEAQIDDAIKLKKNGVETTSDGSGSVTGTRYYRDGKLVWSLDHTKTPPGFIPSDAVWEEVFKYWRLETEKEYHFIDRHGVFAIIIERDGYDYHGKLTSFVPSYRNENTELYPFKGRVFMTGKFVKSKRKGFWMEYFENGIVKAMTYKDEK